jgi:RHS repeat-associated protein
MKDPKTPLPMFRKNILILVLSILAVPVFAQTFTGDEEVCKILAYTYTYSDDVQYNSVQWTTTGGGTIVSGTGTTRNIEWASSGTVTCKLLYNGAVRSEGTKIVNVFSTGTIYGPSAVCSNNNSAILYASDYYGDNGDFTWQWSSNGTSGWTNITTAGNPSITVAPAVLTYYRARMTSCAQGSASNVLSVDVYPAPTPGTLQLTSASNFCLNPGAWATATFTAQNYSPGIAKWLVRTRDGSGSWTVWSVFANSSAASQSYNVQPVNGTTERYYEFKPSVENGTTCAPVFPDPVQVIASPLPIGGTMGAIPAEYCSTTAVYLAVSGKQGTGGSFYMQSKVEPGSWSSAVAVTSPYTVSASGTLPRRYEFFWTSTSPGCTSSSAPFVATIVYPPAAIGTLSTPSSQYCSGDAINLSLASYTGTLTWQYRYKDGNGVFGSWTTFSTASSSSGSFSSSTSGVVRTYEVKVTAQSGSCSTAASNVLSVTVYPPSSIGTFNISPGTEFYNSSPELTLSVSSATGTVSYLYYNGATWVSQVNPVPSLTQSRQLMARAQSGVCAYVNSSTKNVYVYPSPVIMVNGPQEIPIGHSTSLSTQNTFTAYQWMKDNVDIAGASTSSLNVTEPGVYTVKVQGSASSPWTTSLPVTIGSSLMSQTQAINYKVVTNIYKEGFSTADNFYTLAATEVKQNVSYMDGYGRTVQQVAIGQSPLRKDVVQPHRYDDNQIDAYAFLGYTLSIADGRYQPNALRGAGGTYTGGDQYQFYQSAQYIETSAAPYAKSIGEASPLARVFEQGAPGMDWQPGTGHTVRFGFNVNFSASSDAALKNIRKWSMDGPSGMYDDYELAIQTVVDENGNKTWQYTNKLGRTILKRVQLDEVIDGHMTPFLETYFVYDDRGNLALQVPPKAVAKIETGTSWSTTFRDEWCFVYTYDERNRLVEKKTPDAQPIYYGYDPLDRLVLIQDGSLRTGNKWMFVKYDIKGRPVVSGVYQNNVHTTRSAIQLQVLDPLYATGLWYEERGATADGYTNQSFPTQNILQVLIVNYYDNYDFDLNGSDDYAYTAQGLLRESKAVNPWGMPTGSKRLVLETTTWLYNYVFYDRYGRVIQTRSNNHLSTSVNDLTTYSYNFDGTLNYVRQTHTGNGGLALTTQQHTEYDHAGRVKNLFHQIGGEPVVWVSPVNVTITGNTVKKTGGATTGTWDAGAFSQNSIPAGVDGWVEFHVPSANTYKMLGLSDSNPDASYSSIDFAIYLRGEGVVYVYENGAARGLFGSYSPSDIFRVERVNGIVYYKKNGDVFYVSTVSNQSALYGDCSFHDINDSLLDVQIGTGKEVLVASYQYNELGQLIDKNLSGDDQSYPQSLDYRYNIRGWLKSINNAQVASGTDNDDVNDLFGMELVYNQADAALGNTSFFNGNISSVKWKSFIEGTAANDDRKAYVFGYDKSNKLEEANYKAYKLSASNWSADNGTFNESMTYDHNGNIKTLQRKKAVAGSSAISVMAQTMDDLTYTYASGNKLSKVEDASGDVKGFKNGSTATMEYSYNQNGSLEQDLNKGVNAIAYNVLGKPSQMTFSDGRVIQYTYDAAGNKLKMAVTQGGTTTTTDYVGNFVYENNNLSFFGSPEGRIVKTGASFEYQFALTDHQGNTRVLYGNPFESNNLISGANTDCNSTSGFSVNQNVAVSSLILNGETYVKCVSNQATSSPGIWPIGGNCTVQAGERYTFKVLGHSTTSGRAFIYVSTNLGDLIWRGSSLPVGAVNESWVSNDFTIPDGVTYIRVGVLFSADAGLSVGETFYLNKVGLYKHKDDDAFAGFELSQQSTEASQFSNYNTVKIISYSGYATTGTKSYRLTASTSISNEVIGPAKSIKVYTGDIVRLEAYARFLSSNGSGTNVAAVIAGQLQGAFGLTAGGATDVAYQSIGSLFGGGSLIGTAGFPYEDSGAPKAYLNYILFDENYVAYDFGYDQVPATAQIPAAGQKMSLVAKVRKPGYIYIYVSNENPVVKEVYFDDIKIKHVKSPAIQYNEYYPFGLQTASSWTRDNNTNNFLYNGGTELNQNAGVYDLFFRNYDPALGRMTQVDPMADKYGSMSTYNYAFNDPIFWNDPLGDDAVTPQAKPPGYGEKKEEQDPGNTAPFDFGYADAANARADAFFDMLNGGGSAVYNSITYGAPAVRYGPGDGGALSSYIGYMLKGAAAARERWVERLVWKNGTPNSLNPSGEEYGNGKYVLEITTKEILVEYQAQPGEFSKNFFEGPIKLTGNRLFGVSGSFRYSPREDEKYSDYNWVVEVELNGQSEYQQNPNVSRVTKPFYYPDSPHDPTRINGYNKLAINPSTLFNYEQNPEMTVNATLTFFGRSEEGWNVIGTIQYGFSYINGITSIFEPVFSYPDN